MTSLAEVRIGNSGTISEITGDDSVTLRILEMGVTPGAEFKVLGAAPLGDPIEIEIRDYRLSLRKAEALRIKVSSNPVGDPS